MAVKILMLFVLASGIAQDDSYGTKQIFNIVCDRKSHDECPGETLATIAAKVWEQSDVHIDIKTPYLQLSTNVIFANLSSLTINGHGEPSLTTINCTTNSIAKLSAGIVLSNIEKVTLNNLSLNFCGSVIDRKVKNKIYSSALTIFHCKNVQLNRLVIVRSRGIGLTILNYEDGEVIIKSTIFKENTQPKKHRQHSIMGGGGVYIIVSQQNLLDQRTLYYFDNCTFENNSARTEYHKLYHTLNNQGMQLEGYGQGGGISVVIESGTSNVSVSFINCKFIANNAFFGGGLYVSISGSSNLITRNVRVEIRDSFFEGNGGDCDSNFNQSFGGGADLNFDMISDKSTEIIDSQYLMRNVTFVNNCAIVGGGVYYFCDSGTIDSSNSIIFDNCTWQGNQAHLGSAFAMIPNYFLRLFKGFTTNPVFHDCLFSENDVFSNHSHTHNTHTRYAGLGTIYIDNYDIRFHGYNHFVNNWGSAVYITNAIVDFQNSSVDFVNNTGLQGGAIALMGSSVMYVGSNNHYKFINNTAIHEGGAIYVFMTNSAEFITPGSCFIQHSGIKSNNISVAFKGNRATAGHAIYATSIRPCQIINDKTKTLKVINASTLLNVKGITFDRPAETQVATDGAILQGSKSRSTPHMIIPGEKYKHGVILSDDLEHVVTDASFKVSIVETHKGIVQFDDDSTVYVGNEIQLRGRRGSTATLDLQTTSPRKTYIRLELELVECPPGYSFNDKHLTCSCSADAHVGFLRCNRESFYSYLLPGYWAGQMETRNGSELVTSSCAFCKYYDNKSVTTAEIALPMNYSHLNLYICGDTRKGIVCGVCQENYAVHFNSPSYQCKPLGPLRCKLGWLFYVFSEIVPVTVIFISVLIFNIRLNSGAINGFIVFSQLLNSLDIDASGIIAFPDSTVQTKINSWMQEHHIIYGFFTLNIFNAEFLSFCLWNNASALDILAIKYFTILYILLLIMTLIWIVNKCSGRCLGKCCRITTLKASVVHGISTFLMLCYAQCVKISFLLLTRVNFFVKENSEFKPSPRVWLNGEIVFFSREHLPYALPAVFCILTIGVLPPALLLCYPLGNKVLDMLHFQDRKLVIYISNRIPIHCHVSSLKPLLDSIQCCYKDNLRFFAGLYFLYRWMIVLAYVTTTTFDTYYIVVGSILTCILILHSIFQPYIKRVHNVTDTLLFANLIIINFLSFINYYRSRQKNYGSITAIAVVQLVLIYAPLVVMGAYLLVFSCKGASMRGCQQQCMDDHKNLRNLVKHVSTKKGSQPDEEELPYRLLQEDYRN
jgi:predicted outer membrane repeat protein